MQIGLNLDEDTMDSDLVHALLPPDSHQYRLVLPGQRFVRLAVPASAHESPLVESGRPRS